MCLSFRDTMQRVRRIFQQPIDIISPPPPEMWRLFVALNKDPSESFNYKETDQYKLDVGFFDLAIDKIDSFPCLFSSCAKEKLDLYSLDLGDKNTKDSTLSIEKNIGKTDFKSFGGTPVSHFRRLRLLADHLVRMASEYRFRRMTKDGNFDSKPLAFTICQWREFG
ncbi:hypothetical protein N7478_007662 [Penicillium angulare]|uniref:uncharacterized protein n=1 Tax=Penicillium angulare TaxID=116970 RepID=UPI002540A65C|nr:uncharacterized protein N7478_007662 [Penicillium angulare]KAJ5272537.1 hypothetical protein N7478_007662 [Penicillium angulare]